MATEDDLFSESQFNFRVGHIVQLWLADACSRITFASDWVLAVYAFAQAAEDMGEILQNTILVIFI